MQKIADTWCILRAWIDNFTAAASHRPTMTIHSHFVGEDIILAPILPMVICGHLQTQNLCLSAAASHRPTTTMNNHFVGKDIILAPYCLWMYADEHSSPLRLREYFTHQLKILYNIALLLICGTPRMSSPTINWVQFENGNITSQKK